MSRPIRTACLLTLGLWAAAADLEAIYPGLIRDGRLIPCAAGSLGREVKDIELPMDTALFAKRNNFGYSSEEVRRYFSAPLRYTVDATGLDRSLITAPPAPGVHPRVLFNPEDLPAIRKRQSSPAGKAAMDAIRAHLATVITGPKAKYATEYQRLAAGDRTVDIHNKDAVDLPYCVVYEAFRCLIDDDAEGGRKVAAVLATMAPVISARLDAEIAKAKAAFAKDQERFAQKGGERPIDRSNDFNTVAIAATFQGTIGLGYDFAHRWMDEGQRSALRATIAKATRGMTNIGCETPRAFHTGLSNHIPWENRMIETVTSIEGEEGYDAATYKRCEAAQTNFITSIYATGEAFEGWAKNFMFIEHAIVLGKRGNDLLACSRMRATFNNFYVASMNPWGNGFTFCDSLGGSGIKIARNADVAMYHALFPEDLAGNVIYRNQLEGDPAKILGGPVNTHHYFAVTDALLCALYATDMPLADLDEGLKRISAGRPLTYFSEDTGNLITRSSWEKDALYLNYLTRTVPGGHVYADRSHFNLYGLGRTWSIYQGSRQIREQYGPVMRSVLMCDGEGPSIMEGRSAAFVDRPLASFTVTDLGDSWNWQNNYVVRAPKGVERQQHPFTYNHFRFRASPIPWMDLPIGQLPHWETAEKPDASFHADWWKRPQAVKKAFRTAGVVRGPHPYALIVDDLQRDDQPHAYEWNMVMPPDLSLASATATGSTELAQADILLDEKSGDRHLLVRVLSAAALDAGAPATVGITPVPNPPQKDLQVNKLHIPSQAVSPDFRILLFPHRTGQPLPTTTWSADHSTATVAWADQTDQLAFTPGTDGRTRVRIVRGGAPVVAVE